MRFSDQARVEPKRISERKTNAEFMAAVAAQCDEELGRAAILLVGGSDTRSLQLRRAQALVRYDRRASYFSQAALIVRFNPKKPEQSVGLEVSLEPQASALQVPERNGVTPFRLRRYLDDELYPNLALIALTLHDEADLEEPEPDEEPASAGAPPPSPRAGKSKRVPKTTGEARKTALLAAARNPCRQRDLYPLWDQLAPWSRYAYAGETVKNPLLEGVPMPSAAFCEYAYATQGVDIVPGSSDHQCCPELLWATFLRWQASLAPSVKRIRSFSVVRDEHATPRASLPMTIDL